MHETYAIAGWPIPTRSWTSTHFALFMRVQDIIDRRKNGKPNAVRHTSADFTAALDAALGGKKP